VEFEAGHGHSPGESFLVLGHVDGVFGTTRALAQDSSMSISKRFPEKAQEGTK
jgi:hypothetical protein